jgi:FtsP/CotA-like multicopper oxidase with cupredoxin domain
MERRQFLKLGAASTAAVVSPAVAWAASTIRLTIEAVDYQMIDGKFVFHLLFLDDHERPQPLIRAREGDPIEIEITNGDTRPHGFAVTGIAGATSAGIAPGETRVVSFTAPAGGSYIYHDPTDAPLNRVLGLHGPLIIDPLDGTTPAGSPTPFSRSAQTAQVRAAFDAFGTHPRFPGEKWKPGDPRRDKLWLVSETDSAIAARTAAGDRVTGQALLDVFLPDYFHINGLSGFDTASHGSDGEIDGRLQAIEAKNKQGQPTLIRTMNAGLCTHSMHIHGNHLFECTDLDANDNVYCESNIYERDVWALRPLGRRDMLLPFEQPPDIPNWPPKEEPFPLRYVMHCHCEMSQTAGGGNYPQGLVTHWEMTAPL